MRKVLHLIKEYRGNYPLLNSYVKALPGDNFYSIVCYLRGRADGKNDLDIIASDVRYLDFDKKSLKYLSPGVIFSLYKIMKSEKIDIVHCHRHRATVTGTIAAFFAGVPNVISHVHGLNRTRTRKRYITNWFILKKVKKIIAVSDSVRHDIINTNRNLDPAKVVTVRNGIDLKLINNLSISRKDIRLRLGIPENKIVFGTVGRLTVTKGQSYLIKAFSDIRKKIPNSILLIIGDGSLSEKLKQKAEDLGISSLVLFPGYRDDICELLKSIDVFVLPSIAEGLSMALLEAMASKLPVIASDVGGISEVLEHNCGLLIPAKDPHALAKAMKKLFDLNEDKKKIMGNKARKRIEEAFTVNIMSKKLVEIYESLFS